MTIDLKISVSEPNKLSKTLISVGTIEGSLRNESSISNPSILASYDGNVIQANYAYISDFNRYYYINDIISIRNGIWRLELTCDVLMSFDTGIKASMALIEETEEVGTERVNEYVSNESFKRLVKDKTDIVTFPSGFNDYPYFILITAGGIVS